MADARFPIQRAPEKLGVVPTTAVRANLDVSTGGQELGRAIAGFGQAGFDIVLRGYLMEADTQLDKAKMQADEEHTRYMLGLDAIEDTSDETGLYKKAFKTTMATRERFMPTNGVAAREYKSYLVNNTSRWGRDTILAKRAKRKDKFRAVGFEKQTKAIQSGQFLDYFTHLEKGRESKFDAYTDEEVARLKQSTIEAHERYLRTQGVQAKERLEIEREKARDIISKTIRDGKDATSLIEGSPLDETEQWGWFEKQRIDLERRAKGEDSPFRVRQNEKVNADLSIRAILDPAGLDPKEVTDAVGKDITTADGTRILTELEDPASALKRSEVKFYVDQINAMDIKAWEKSKHMDALREFMRRNPEANVAQLEAFWDREIKPIVLNFFERLLPKRPRWWATLTEEKRLGRKRIESLKEKGLWESLPEAEKRRMQGITPKAKDIRLESAPDIRLDDYWGQLTDKQKQDIWKQQNNPDKMNRIVEMLRNATP